MLASKRKLHYDLSFLEKGMAWYPLLDETRFNNYAFAREQFELVPEDMIMKMMPDGLLDLSKGYSDFAWATRLLAYPRLLTLKTVDMVIGQPPLINAQSKDKYIDIIRDIRASSCLNDAMKIGLIDYSRFGVMLLRVFKDSKGKAHVTAWDPSEWVPVFYSDGTNRIRYNVIGWHDVDKLFIQIHDTEDGSYEERIYNSPDGTFGDLISAKKYNKTSGKPLFFAIVNTPTTTNPLGTNDYEIINALSQKAIQRLMAILRVLDEHADPSMVGPHTLLSRTDSGELVFKTNKYYAVGKDEMKPEYLVWNANLDSSFRAFDELCKQIYILSEMGETFIGAPSGSGNVVSGTAMRFKMISPLEKARRIQSAMTEPLKNIISSILSIENYKIDAKEINIIWRDSLPKDPKEVAELTRMEAGAVATKPLNHALMDNYDLDEETANHYVDAILSFQKIFKEVTGNPDNIDPATGRDGRSHIADRAIDTRKRDSIMDPAGEQNRGDDENNNLE